MTPGWSSRTTAAPRWGRRWPLWRRAWPGGSANRKPPGGHPRPQSRGHSGGPVTMPEQARKLPEIMKEMSETLCNPGGVPSSEAAHVALFFTNVAWNESVGLDHAREGYRNILQPLPTRIGVELAEERHSEGPVHDTGRVGG